MGSQPALITVVTAVISGVVVFTLGQIFQQYVLEPIREFQRQRADAIYFAVHFIEYVNHETDWDDDDRKIVKQMRSALLVSVQLIPCFDSLSRLKVFGLPSRDNVNKAAKNISFLAQRLDGPMRKGEPSDIALGHEVGILLGSKIEI